MKDISGKVIPTINGFKEYDNGGKGSGNFGHSGRPGEVGGSGDGQGGSGSKSEKKTEAKKKTITELETKLEEARKKVADNKDPQLDAKLNYEAGEARAQLEKAKSETRAVLDEIAHSVMGGMLEDYDISFEKLITPVQEGKLTKKQAEQLMLDGKPEVSSDKKTIYYATRGKLGSSSTSEKSLKEDLKYCRDYWKEREGD